MKRHDKRYEKQRDWGLYKIGGERKRDEGRGKEMMQSDEWVNNANVRTKGGERRRCTTA